MIQLIFQQQYLAFVLILVALVFSLTFHEYGHGKMASLIGDDTAERAGRLTLNPIPHIHPIGLLMVILIGIGFARPVPADPRKFNTRWGIMLVAAAGPAMNLLLAILFINIYSIGLQLGISFFTTEVGGFFFSFLALINLLLMFFNLLPIGPLDGSYILPYALPRDLRMSYLRLNQKYGLFLLLGIILADFLGVPVVESLWDSGYSMLGYLRFF